MNDNGGGNDFPKSEGYGNDDDVEMVVEYFDLSHVIKRV